VALTSETPGNPDRTHGLADVFVSITSWNVVPAVPPPLALADPDRSAVMHAPAGAAAATGEDEGVIVGFDDDDGEDEEAGAEATGVEAW
jgi:hypothetical protein